MSREIRLEDLVRWADDEATRLQGSIAAFVATGLEPHQDLVHRCDLARATQMELSKIADARRRR